MRRRRNQLGCALAAFALMALIGWLIVEQPAVRIALVGLIVAVLLGALLRRWGVVRATRSFRRMHGAAGKDLLLVYTASPHWQPYIETRWLPRWDGRVVVLNRSAPRWQLRPEATLWRRLAGPVEHTPVAIVVPPHGAPRIVRFYLAFREYKHGNAAQLLTRERVLQDYLDALDRPRA